MKNLTSILFLLFIFNTLTANFISQRNWRWRNDNGNETNATWKADEMKPITINDLNAIRLRIELDNNTSEVINFDKALEYTNNPNLGPWKRVGVIGNNEFMLIGSHEIMEDGTPTTRQLTGNSANPFVAGKVMINSEENDHKLTGKTKTEYEWILRPTPFIEKNTQYFFRTPVGDYPEDLPSLTTGPNIPNTFKLIANGSFERDLTGWTGTVSGNGACNFEINTTDSVIHSGYKSLHANVTATDARIAAIQITTDFDAGQDSVHLLQFWARSRIDKADMYAVVIDGTDTAKCFFKIRTGWYNNTSKPSESHGGWYQYHFPFRAKSSSAKLCFYFTSPSDYYLDDVEILDQAAGNGSADVYTTSMWHNNRSGYGWYNADNDISVDLPDGRVAWFFNDSFLGINSPSDNYFYGDKFVRNAMVVQEKDKRLTTKYSNAGGMYNTYFIPVEADPTPDHTNLYWMADGFIEGGKLKQMLIEVSYTASSSTQATGRTYLATFNLSSLVLEKIDRLPSGYDYENILDDGDYFYIYGVETNGLTGYTKVARAKKGDFAGNSTSWQYYNRNLGWQGLKDSASRICNYYVNAVKKIGTGNYAMVLSDAMSGQEKLSFAPTPLGPWTKSILLYQVPSEINYWNYMPNIHTDLFTPGKYTISYSVNCYEEWGPAFNDKYFYMPRYIQADLLKLSPYTGGSNKSIGSAKNYTLKARHSGKLLQVETDGSTIDQATETNGANQLWKISDLGEGFYKIEDYTTGKALSVKQSSMEDGALLELSDFTHAFNQCWSIDSLNNQYFRIISRNSGRALEIASSGLTDGAKADQHNYEEQSNQQWLISLCTNLPSKTDITKEISDGISLYPNPADHLLSVKGLSGEAELEIYDIQGKAIKRAIGTTLDVSGISSGVYLLTIKTKGITVHKTFVKK